ncbi:MAG: NADH-quinone oxidoreductase subunit L, partial [Elusimicrobia bacterium]|nr:NADH-quinone oxidoreductase subunit L [Elusimicrobiota bacterium]
MLEHVYLIALIPLAASLVILFGFKENPRSRAPYLGIAAMLWCFLQSCAVFHRVAASALPLSYEANMEWFRLPVQIAGKAFALPLQLGVLIDGPAALMLCVVTLVSLMVQIYSLGYMHGDPRLRRYYAFLSFFTASMLGLVVSSDLLVTFMCWELVGVSSYLLIGFWF